MDEVVDMNIDAAMLNISMKPDNKRIGQQTIEALSLVTGLMLSERTTR